MSITHELNGRTEYGLRPRFGRDQRARGGPLLTLERDPGAGQADAWPRHIEADPATVGNDLAKLVLALIDIVRRLMEKQAIRRIDAGSLSDDQIERMGETFLVLDQKMTELKAVLGLEDGDLDLDLGPLGRALVDE